MAAKDLRTIVAEMAKVAPERIGPEFPLQNQAFSSSLKKAALVASIRRHLGVDCMRAALAKNYGELEAMVSGQAPASPAPAQPAPQQPAPLAVDGKGEAAGFSCGVDLELVQSLPQAPDYRTHDFYVQNFTEAERAYCSAQPDPRMHFAARWAAKEALRKCDPLLSAERFNALELVRPESGRVFFQRLSAGAARRLPHAVSLTHTPQMAAAVVILPKQDRPLRAWAPALVSVLAAAAAAWLFLSR